MNMSIIPESAPFDAEQRAWLNGFLAGWTGLSGESEQVDGLLAAPIVEPEEDFPWHDPNLDLDERLKLAEEKPVERKLMAAMAQLDCGACGYLCQTYSEAIASGTEKNLTLCSPGGKDTAKALKKLVKAQGSTNATNGSAANGNAIDSSVESNGYSRSNPFPAKLKCSDNLNKEGSSKHTCHVEIDLSGSNLTYRVGDALGVYPTNCEELVNTIVKSLDADGEVMVTTSNGAETTLRNALIEHSNLQIVEEELVQLLATSASDFDERAAMQTLLEDDDALDELDVLDVLQLAPSAKPTPQDFVVAIGVMNPRLYSIASSMAAHPEEVHLTVGRVESEVRGRTRKGVASTMFADRVSAGSKVSVFIHKSSHFTVPGDANAPMIMVGPGTGIAPFRAFLEERSATAARGDNWLFFGDQHAASDFLYEDELSGMQQKGLLTKLSTAFSRDQDEKIYVQTRMVQEGAELWQWLERGAYFFVCGDARRMAVDVDRALHEVVTKFGSRSESEAKQYVNALKETHRYVRDVY